VFLFLDSVNSFLFSGIFGAFTWRKSKKMILKYHPKAFHYFVCILNFGSAITFDLTQGKNFKLNSKFSSQQLSYGNKILISKYMKFKLIFKTVACNSSIK